MREFGEIDTPKEEFAVDWAEMDHANNVRLAVEPRRADRGVCQLHR